MYSSSNWSQRMAQKDLTEGRDLSFAPKLINQRNRKIRKFEIIFIITISFFVWCLWRHRWCQSECDIRVRNEKRGWGRGAPLSCLVQVSTYLGVGGQAFEEALFPVDLFKDDQTLPSFTRVVGFFLVLTKEEKSALQKVKQSQKILTRAPPP